MRRTLTPTKYPSVIVLGSAHCPAEYRNLSPSRRCTHNVSLHKLPTAVSPAADGLRRARPRHAHCYDEGAFILVFGTTQFTIRPHPLTLPHVLSGVECTRSCYADFPLTTFLWDVTGACPPRSTYTPTSAPPPQPTSPGSERD